MSYLRLRDQAVELIKEAMLPLYPRMSVQAHPGIFTEATIRKDAQKSPAILTSLVRAADGVHANSVTFVSWVLFRAEAEDALCDGALRIVSALTLSLREADFPVPVRDTRIESECVHAGRMDGAWTTLWAVQWTLELGGRALPLIGETLEGVGGMDGFGGTTRVGTVETGGETSMEDD